MTDAPGHPDPDAARALGRLLTSAVGHLSKVSPPAMVTANPRSREGGGTAEFLARQDVFAGGAFWGAVSSSDSGHWNGKGDKAVFRREGPISTAYEALFALQEGEWRGLFERATGRGLTSETLALAMQHGAAWLLLSPTEGGAGTAYLIDPSGSLLAVGEPEPVDTGFWNPVRPVRLARIWPEAWPVLHRVSPAFPAVFAPGTQGAEREAAHQALAALVRRALARMAEVPDGLRFLAVSQLGLLDSALGSVARLWRMVVAGQSAIAGSPYLPRDAYDDRLAQEPKTLTHLDAVVDTLEEAGWRDLFGQVFMPLGRYDSLALLVRGAKTWVIAAQTAVFAVEADGLRFVGACDHTDDPARLAGIRIYLFPEAASAGAYAPD